VAPAPRRTRDHERSRTGFQTQVAYAAATHTRAGLGTHIPFSDIPRTYAVRYSPARTFVPVHLHPAMSRQRDRNRRRKNAMFSCVCAAPFVLTHLGSYGGASALARRSLGPLRQQVTRPEKSARECGTHGRSAGKQRCRSAGVRSGTNCRARLLVSTLTPWGSCPRRSAASVRAASSLYSPVYKERAGRKCAGFVRWPARRPAPAGRCSLPATAEVEEGRPPQSPPPL